MTNGCSAFGFYKTLRSCGSSASWLPSHSLTELNGSFIVIQQMAKYFRCVCTYANLAAVTNTHKHMNICHSVTDPVNAPSCLNTGWRSFRHDASHSVTQNVTKKTNIPNSYLLSSVLYIQDLCNYNTISETGTYLSNSRNGLVPVTWLLR